MSHHYRKRTRSAPFSSSICPAVFVLGSLAMEFPRGGEGRFLRKVAPPSISFMFPVFVRRPSVEISRGEVVGADRTVLNRQ